MFELHKAIDGKGKTGEIIHKEYVTARDKTYLNGLISALKSLWATGKIKIRFLPPYIL